MHALIDCDIFCYEIGSMKYSKDFSPDRVPLPWPIIKRLVDERIFSILNAVKAETWQGYLTGKGNFRFDVATIRPYKEHRGKKPFWYQGIRNYLHQQRNVHIVSGYEADDAMSICLTRSSGTDIICTRDKDLRQVSGYHYGWASGKQPERPIHWISELDGWKSFCCQCLTGDPVDNIPGLYNVGKKSAAVQRVQAASTELECFSVVKLEYEKRFGTYWDMFLCENGRLLWMLRSEDDDWYPRQKEYTEKLNGWRLE